MEIERQTLADAVRIRLRTDILNGTLVDGQELNQVELAQRFDVSRVPVREALQRLMAEGLVKGDPYRRVVVVTIGAAELEEMLAIREELEVFALRTLLSSAQSIDVQQARAVNRQFKDAKDDERRIELDKEIHASFMELNPLAAKLVADLRNRSQKYLGHVLGGSSRRIAAFKEHEQILAAVESKDEQAALEMLRLHISTTRRLLTGASGKVTSAGD